MKKSILILAAALAASACAAPKAPQGRAMVKGPKPDWVDGSSMEFPREQYLIGVASADDLDSAKDRARGEISKIFSAQVTVNTQTAAAESTAQSTGRPDANSFSQSVANSVATVSKTLLEGVEITETWRDETTKVYYALAVLEKAKAAAACADKLAGFDGQLKEWNAQLAQAADRLPRAKAAMKMLSLLRARQRVAGHLRVLGGAAAPAPVDDAAAHAAASKSLAEINVSVAVTGAQTPEVATGIIQGLSEFGFQAAAPAAATADIVVTADVNTAPMETTDPGWKFARSYATVSLKDGRTAKVFLQFDSTEKGSSGDYATAARRSLAGLSQRVSQQVKDGISAYFENQ